MEKLQSWQTVSTRELVKSKWLRVRVTDFYLCFTELLSYSLS